MTSTERTPTRPPLPLITVPNALSVSRLPIAAGVFVAIEADAWGWAAALFAVAAATDWLDGWWARRFGSMTAVGRALDPLTDKVLVNGAFVFLTQVPQLGVGPWLVTLVISRELIVTAVRGLVEATGQTFGADRWGKLKTVLQMAFLLAAFAAQAARPVPEWADAAVAAMRWAMLVATVGSGVNYVVRAIPLVKGLA